MAIARELRDGQAALPLDFDVLSAAVPADEPRLEVGYLLTLAPELSLLPLVLLDVFSANASRGRSGPVPVPARIGWEVLVALGGEDRERIGGPALLDCSMMDLYRRVYPSTPPMAGRQGQPSAARTVRPGRGPPAMARRRARRPVPAGRGLPDADPRTP